MINIIILFSAELVKKISFFLFITCKICSFISSVPVLVTFDDLLHLGSPPFEFGSVYGKKLAWFPIQWTWNADKYGIFIDGVQNKAIRLRLFSTSSLLTSMIQNVFRLLSSIY